MQEHIYAYTESSAAPYPAYVSINKTDEGVSIAVRSAGDELASEILLPPSVYTHLVAAVRGDTMIEIATAQLKGLALAAQGFAEAFRSGDFEFEFQVGEKVAIQPGGEVGLIRGCAYYASKENEYLVSYKSVDGQSEQAWWAEGLLEPVDDELPTDADSI